MKYPCLKRAIPQQIITSARHSQKTKKMSFLLQNLKAEFDASASKVANMEAPVTLFEKFHVLTLDYRTPIIASILYVLIVSYFSRINRQRASSNGVSENNKRTSSRNKNVSEDNSSRYTPFKCLVIAHNVFLCLYSAAVFLSALPLLARPYFSKSVLEAFCDVQKTTFHSGIHFLVWNFYVSKYYELLDTAILLIKGKPSSFLQTFHHSGSILGMWLLTITHAPAGWIFVLFNSFIHTIMYFYYTLTCLGYRPTWKRILTTMQIVQFCVGNPLGLVYAVLPGCLPLEMIPPENVIGKLLGTQLRSLYACLFVNTFFISSLVILFTDFSRKTYGPKKTEEFGGISSKKPTAKTVKAVKVVKEEKEETVKASKSTKTTKASKSVKEPAKPVKAAKEPASSTKKSTATKTKLTKATKAAASPEPAPTTIRRSRRS